MPGPTESLWQLVPDVRSSERSPFLFFAGLLALVSAAQTVGLVGSEALFLVRFGAPRLPQVFIAASSVTVLGTFAYAFVVGRARNDRLFLYMASAAAALLFAAAWALGGRTGFVAFSLFCLYYLLQAIFLNHFFTFAGDYFDTLTAKRLFPLFAIGASLGSALGGALAAFLAGAADPTFLVATWGLLLAAAALVLALGRRSLRRWGPLDLEESDETSVEGMRGAVHFLHASPLGRTLVFSALGMVVALFLAQYLYLEIFARRFPDTAQLASFLGIYLAVTNLLEICVELFITPRVIRRFGVPSANLIHPALTLMSFGALGLQYGIATGVIARMNRELVENAMAFTIRGLVLNALPIRLRGRVRPFLEGIVVNAGMAAAGLVLLAMVDPEPMWLCLAGGGAALLFLGANVRVRRAYLATLVDELRAGRLDVADLGDELGGWETSRLAEFWEQLLSESRGRPSHSLFELIPTLAKRQVIDPLVRAASHPQPEVRRACIHALAEAPDASPEGPLALALDDPDPGVRLAALRGLVRVGSPPEFLAPRIRDLLADESPSVRAEAALQCGDEGNSVLRDMIHSDTPAVAAAALGAAPASLAEVAATQIHDPQPEIRAAALECAARIAPGPPLESRALAELLRHSDPRVRAGAVALLARFATAGAPALLAEALADPAALVRSAAEEALGTLGDVGVTAAETVLSADTERAVEGAFRVLAASELPRGRLILARELRRLVASMWYALLSYQLLPANSQIAGRFLRAGYQDAVLRNRRLAFRLLELVEDRKVIRNVERVLRFGSIRPYANALEVLSNLGDRESARLLVLMHESGPLDERARSAREILSLPSAASEVLDASRGSEVRWLRTAAQLIESPDEYGGEAPLMERLLALKQIPLFSHLSLEQLEAVNRIAKEVVCLPDEVIVQEGDPGGELYLLIEGRVRVVKNYGRPDETELTPLTALSYFGEMAVLDDAPRSATNVAVGRPRLLSLDGGSLKELILEMPEIAFVILRVLTRRVREAESRLGGQ